MLINGADTKGYLEHVVFNFCSYYLPLLSRRQAYEGVTKFYKNWEGNQHPIHIPYRPLKHDSQKTSHAHHTSTFWPSQVQRLHGSNRAKGMLLFRATLEDLLKVISVENFAFRLLSESAI